MPNEVTSKGIEGTVAMNGCYVFQAKKKESFITKNCSRKEKHGEKDSLCSKRRTRKQGPGPTLTSASQAG